MSSSPTGAESPQPCGSRAPVAAQRRWGLVCLGLFVLLLAVAGGAVQRGFFVLLARAGFFILLAAMARRWARGLRGRLFAAILLGTGLVAYVFAGLHIADYRFVVTPSIPEGLYSTEPRTGPLAAGTYACLDIESPVVPALFAKASAEGWLPDEWRIRPPVKRVAGVPGQRVTRVDGHIFVDGLRLPNSRPARTTARPLPIAALPYTLGADEYWLASHSPDGFDSRYFGPVHLEALNCVATPVLLW